MLCDSSEENRNPTFNGMDSVSSVLVAWSKIFINNISIALSKLQLTEYIHSITRILIAWGNVFTSDTSPAFSELQITNYIRLFTFMTVFEEISSWFALQAMKAQEETIDKEQAERRKREDEDSDDDEWMQYLVDDED
jgi:hypothetical protein